MGGNLRTWRCPYIFYMNSDKHTVYDNAMRTWVFRFHCSLSLRPVRWSLLGAPFHRIRERLLCVLFLWPWSVQVIILHVVVSPVLSLLCMLKDAKQQ